MQTGDDRVDLLLEERDNEYTAHEVDGHWQHGDMQTCLESYQHADAHGEKKEWLELRVTPTLTLSRFTCIIHVLHCSSDVLDNTFSGQSVCLEALRCTLMSFYLGGGGGVVTLVHVTNMMNLT
jgi:hypothetical protein